MSRDNEGKCGGILLCGGASRRMGQPKAWLAWGEQTLLEHLVEVLREATCPVCVVASPNQKLPQLHQDVTIAFDPVEYQGPLQGMQIGLDTLKNECHAAFVLSCDMPFMSVDFVREVCDCLADHDIAIPRDANFHHPLAAVYRTSLSARIADLLAADMKRPRFLLDRSDTLEFDPARMKSWDSRGLTLRNVNTPEEYEEALRHRKMPTP